MHLSVTNLKDKYLEKLSNYIYKNDNIYLECDLFNFKEISLLKDKNFFCKFYYDIFEELIGENGTFVTPSFTYSWASNTKDKLFNIKKTLSKCGIFSNYALQKQKLFRSNDPMFSLLISGPFNFNYDSKCSFGKNSIYHQMFDANFKIIHFGLKYFDPTFIHFVEQKFDHEVAPIIYRKNFRFKGYYIDMYNEKHYDYWDCFMRNEKNDYKYSYDKIENIFDSKNLSKFKINNANIFITSSKHFCETYFNKLLNNKNYFIYYE